MHRLDLKIQDITAPVEKNHTVGTAEIFDSNGNILKEVDVIIKDEILKANFWDYMKKNLNQITSGTTIF